MDAALMKSLFAVVIFIVLGIILGRKIRHSSKDSDPESEKMSRTFLLSLKINPMILEANMLTEHLNEKLEHGFNDQEGLLKLQSLITEILKIDAELQKINPNYTSAEESLGDALETLGLIKRALKR